MGRPVYSLRRKGEKYQKIHQGEKTVSLAWSVGGHLLLLGGQLVLGGGRAPSACPVGHLVALLVFLVLAVVALVGAGGNCIKIGLPGKLILGYDFQANMGSIHMAKEPLEKPLEIPPETKF